MRNVSAVGWGGLGGSPTLRYVCRISPSSSFQDRFGGWLGRHMPKGHAYWDGRKEASEDLHSQTPGLGRPLPEHKGLLGCDEIQAPEMGSVPEISRWSLARS